MILKVRLFAVLKDRLGESNLSIEVPQNLTAENLKSSIKDLYPAVADILDLARVAVNEEFVSDTDLINEEDTVALIPPSSGG